MTKHMAIGAGFLVTAVMAMAEEPVRMVPFERVRMEDALWKPMIAKLAAKTLPHALVQTEVAQERLRLCAEWLESGGKTPKPATHRFNTSDLYKVMEGAAMLIQAEPNPEIERQLDRIIDVIARAQRDDGYLYISHIVGNPEPGMGDRPYSFLLHSHELYNIGHLYEAAVAYARATGKTKLLDVAEKSARHVNRVFFEGDPNYNDGKPVMQAPGHEEIELGLVKLYNQTGNRLYLDMAHRFLAIRGVTFVPDGKQCDSPLYAQQQKPVAEQRGAVGHAVRAAYLYAAMAEVDSLRGTDEYSAALDSIWHDIVDRKMHISGGLGAVQGIEGFGPAYELPNKDAYLETCAAVGNVLFNMRMFLKYRDAKYVDVAEVALLNNCLSGIGLDGTSFFYPNPLEADDWHAPRSPWFGTACCPANIARLVPQVPQYIYATGEESIYCLLYGGNSAQVKLGEETVAIRQTTHYPFDGTIKFEIDPRQPAAFSLYLRIPSWAGSQLVPGKLYRYLEPSKGWKLTLNGRPVDAEVEKGFVKISRTWQAGDRVELDLPMSVKASVAIPEVEADRDRVAFSRGPLLLCGEGVDNHGAVQRFFVDPAKAEREATVSTFDKGIMAGLPEVAVPARELKPDGSAPAATLELIPYFSWSNRDRSSMTTWFATDKHLAQSDPRDPANLPFPGGIVASHTCEFDSVESLNLRRSPATSQEQLPRWTSWPQKGKFQWVEFSFDQPQEIRSVGVYWFNDRAGIRLPKAWHIEVPTAGKWERLPIYNTDEYSALDSAYNTVHPADPLTTDRFRIVMVPQENACVGILSVDVDAKRKTNAGVKVGGMRCEYLEDPLGIDVTHPRLSWILESEERGQKQTAYRILVADSAEKLAGNEGNLWDSGKVESNRTVLVPYVGKALQPRMRCFWKVQVWDQDSLPSEWSEPARWSTGLPEKLDARWVGAGTPMDADPWLRKNFVLAEEPEDALAYVASVGYHELYINGRKVGDQVLSPSVSDLSKRARYVTYDISPYLRKGTNTVAFWLGAGWADWEQYHVEDKPLVLAEIDVALPDGKPVVVNTDETWKIHPSCSSLLGEWKPGRYGGEYVDSRKVLPGWNAVGFDDSAWALAKVFTPDVQLSAEKIEPNRKGTAIDPVAIDEVEPKVYRVDMGRNFSGWTEIALRGEPGKRINLSFSEHADGKNEFRIQSACTLDDRGRGFFRNRFNYSAGRWITISGLDRKPALADIRGFLVRSDYRRVGHFSCSNPLLNKIYDTVLWTFESLSLGGYVVDCPHRERMGYGGDAHATMETALDNYGMGAFFTKWIEDWRDVQKPDGDLPYTAPTKWGGGGPAWSGVCVTLPWAVHERYGDLRILEETYPTMQRWISFLDTKSRSNLLVKWGGGWDFLGDWVPPGKDQGKNRVDDESTLFFNNCYYLYNVRIVADVAERLGKPGDAKVYRARAEEIRRAIHKRFFHPKTHTYANGGQLYLALPLFVGVPPEKLRPAIMGALEKEILEAKGGYIDTGIHGTYFLIKTLTALGRNDLVFAMATKRDYPGWGYMLEKGATTVWEQWDGKHSLLHSSFLSIGAWFIEGIGGIQPDPAQPGYSHFFIKPGVVGDLSWAKADLDSVHGKISSHWKIEGGTLFLDVVVPPNTTATAYLPAQKSTDVATPEGADFQRMENGCALFAVDSGRYRFSSTGFRHR